MILGISTFHDSGIAIADDQGHILFAVAEERFSRKKSDAIFPRQSLFWAQSKVDLSQVTTVIAAGISKRVRASKAMTQWYFREKTFIAFDGQRKYRFPFGFAEAEPFDSNEFQKKCLIH